jgi:hypothetical protein
MYPVATRIACTACKREVFFAIRLRHARLQLIHIFPGLQATPSSAWPGFSGAESVWLPAGPGGPAQTRGAAPPISEQFPGAASS